MDVTMEISSGDLSEEGLDQLTRQLAGALREETDIAPVLPTADNQPGAKGDPVTIGTLILTFISSGAAVALLEVLKTYFSREPSLKVDLRGPDGSEISLSAQNMDSESLDQTLGRIKKLLPG